MYPGEEPPNLLSQAPIEVRPGFPLLVFDFRRLRLVKLPMRELLLAFPHDAFILGLLALVPSEAVGSGGEVSSEYLSSALWDMLVE